MKGEKDVEIEELANESVGACDDRGRDSLRRRIVRARNGKPNRSVDRRWNTVYRRFRRRAESGVLSQVVEVLQNEALSDADFSVLSLESAFMKSSPSAAGALKNGPQAIGGRKAARDQDTCDRRRSR